MGNRMGGASLGGDRSVGPTQGPVDAMDLHVAVSTEQLKRLTNAFEGSARRWEMVVYPSLFAFIILAAYGFYLVYSLANDVAFLAQSVDRNMTHLVINLENVSHDMDRITTSVDEMTASTSEISNQVALLSLMSEDMRRMQLSVNDMSYSARYMQGDLRVMNHTFGRPIAAMSRPISFARNIFPF